MPENNTHIDKIGGNAIIDQSGRDHIGDNVAGDKVDHSVKTGDIRGNAQVTEIGRMQGDLANRDKNVYNIQSLNVYHLSSLSSPSGKIELPATLNTQIIEFLQSLPILTNEEGQRAFIYASGADAALQAQIRFGLPLAEFVPLLVEALLNYGELEDGRHALHTVLETSKGYVGQDRQVVCDSIMQELDEYLKIVSNKQDQTANNFQEKPFSQAPRSQLYNDRLSKKEGSSVPQKKSFSIKKWSITSLLSGGLLAIVFWYGTGIHYTKVEADVLDTQNEIIRLAYELRDAAPDVTEDIIANEIQLGKRLGRVQDEQLRLKCQIAKCSSEIQAFSLAALFKTDKQERAEYTDNIISAGTHCQKLIQNVNDISIDDDYVHSLREELDKNQTSANIQYYLILAYAIKAYTSDDNKAKDEALAIAQSEFRRLPKKQKDELKKDFAQEAEIIRLLEQ